MRAIIIAVLCVSLALAEGVTRNVSSTHADAASPVLAVSRSAPPQDVWTLHATGLPGFRPVTVVVLDPDGAQSVRMTTTAPDGSLVLPLSPPHPVWETGVFRVVVGFPDHTAVSALFSTGDGSPSLLAQPAITSPSSAFNVIGTGLPPNTDIGLVVHPGNLRAPRPFTVRTDAAGMFSLYLWPEDLGEPFFEVGSYYVDAPGFALSAPFSVYEKPVGSRISPIGDVLPGGSLSLSTTYYQPDRYLWGIYASDDLTVRGQFLIGPTDASGIVHADIPLPPGLAPGHYRLSTPYDWGAADFTVLVPTPTPTATPTMTPTDTPTNTPTSTATLTPSPTPRPTKKPTARPRPTATRHPTATPRPTPKRVAHRKAKYKHKLRCHWVHGKKHCSRR